MVKYGLIKCVYLLMDYPSHQLRLTPAIASCYVYDVTLTHMMKAYSDKSTTDKRKIETQAAGLKSIITWFANDTIQECREACGGKGYFRRKTRRYLKYGKPCVYK